MELLPVSLPQERILYSEESFLYHHYPNLQRLRFVGGVFKQLKKQMETFYSPDITQQQSRQSSTLYSASLSTRYR